MQKHFNTAGPSTPDLHYMLDPLSRFELADILALIEQRRYFVLHAPRQTGKTTCLLALRDYLNASGDYAALYANIEAAQAARGQIAVGVATVVDVLSHAARNTFGVNILGTARAALEESGTNAVYTALQMLSQHFDKPLVLLLDEVDALVGDTLIALLRQIRAGYTDRPSNFPHTLVLCGVRDVRDYRMTMADGEVITGGSAFNIKAESLRLGDFSESELRSLYQQHTTATGQVFSEQALQLAWHLTRGQPWLVNALAEQATWQNKENRDRSVRIGSSKLRAAGEALILRNDTHLDQLADKLKEARVRSIIEPMLIGENISPSAADRQYLLDLGLVRLGSTKNLEPANGIYAEVLPRVLNGATQISIHSERVRPDWQDASGQLDPERLLSNFLDFWREHGESMMQTVPYHEAAPHLVLMAYLQRVVNGAGRIEREYAAGSGRLDLLVVHGEVRMAIEVKVWRDGRKDPLAEGLLQLERYLHRLDLTQGFLMIFNQRSKALSWEKRMRRQHALTASGKAVRVLRG